MLVESDTLFWGCRTGIQTEENGKFDLGNLDSIPGNTTDKTGNAWTNLSAH